MAREEWPNDYLTNLIVQIYMYIYIYIYIYINL